MIGGGVFGCNQDKKQMRRSPIQRCEINPFGAARKYPENSVHTTEFSVRDCHAFTDRRGTDPFPVEQHLEDLALIEMMRRPQVPRHLLEGGIFIAAGQCRDYGFRAEEIGNLHALDFLRSSLIFSFCFVIWRSILSMARSIAA